MNDTILSKAGYLLIVLAMVALIFRKTLVAATAPAIAVQIVAVLLMLWARITFGRRSFHAAADPTEGGLVTSGPYRYLRHPIYASVLYFVWAGVLTHLSPVDLALGLVGTAGLAVRIISEEQLVVRRYPEYASYALRTKRLVPFIF